MGTEAVVVVSGVATMVAGHVVDIHLPTIRAVGMDVTGVAFIVFITRTRLLLCKASRIGVVVVASVSPTVVASLGSSR